MDKIEINRLPDINRSLSRVTGHHNSQEQIRSPGMDMGNFATLDPRKNITEMVSAQEMQEVHMSLEENSGDVSRVQSA